MLKTDSTSLHDMILAELRRKLVNGQWVPGHHIPFETQLAEEFGVSRMTMNKVLAQLTREGFLERRRRLGTVVKLPNVQSAILEITEVEKDVASMGLSYSYRLLARQVRPPLASDSVPMALPRNAQVLALQCLHYADEAPFCAEDRIINLSAVSDARNADFEKESPSRWLLRRVPWSSARHTISAENAGAKLAKLLEVKTGTACLVVDRVTELNGLCITVARLSYPGGRHQMVAQFGPR